MELNEYIKISSKYNKVLSLILEKSVAMTLNNDVEHYFASNLFKVNRLIEKESKLNTIKKITSKNTLKNPRLIFKTLQKRQSIRAQVKNKIKQANNDIIKICKKVQKDIEACILKNDRLSKMKTYIEENYISSIQLTKKISDKELNVHQKMYDSCSRILELCDFLKDREFENKYFLEKKKVGTLNKNEFINENHSSNDIAEKLIELSEEIARFKKIYPKTLKIEPFLDKYDTKEIFKDYVLLAGVGGINIDIGLTNILNKLLKKVNKIRRSIHNIREINKKNLNRILNNREIFSAIITKYNKKNINKEIIKSLCIRSTSIRKYKSIIEDNNIEN